MATFDTRLLDSLSLPIGDLIAAVGRGVADAQRDMDTASIAMLKEVYESSEGLLHELQRIGYRPTWYHIPEAQGEIQVALTVSGQEGTSSSANAPIRARAKLYATPIDAGYASRFNFTLQAASKVTFKIVPVPPSGAAEAVQVVPALVGLQVSEARERLVRLGINGQFGDAGDSDVVASQDPAPGSILPIGGTVTVE